EGDQGEVGGVQHQLHTHERHQSVAPHQHGHRADAEQDAGEHQVVDQAHCSSPSPWSCWSGRSGGVASGSSTAGLAPSGELPSVGAPVSLSPTAALASSGELTCPGGVPGASSYSRSVSVIGAPLAICSVRTVCTVAYACPCSRPRTRSTVVIDA